MFSCVVLQGRKEVLGSRGGSGPREPPPRPVMMFTTLNVRTHTCLEVNCYFSRVVLLFAGLNAYFSDPREASSSANETAAL
jgi:hypothetical protein